MSRLIAIACALFASVAVLLAGPVEDYAAKVAPLIHPAKLATLGARGANPRVQKVTYWLATARAAGVNHAQVADMAVRSVGMTNTLAVELTRATMLRNV